MSLVQRKGPSGARLWAIENPDRKNAITPEALHAIAATCPTLSGEVVVLRGAGGGPFCAGFDLTRLGGATSDSLPDAPLSRATDAMERADATFIAVVEDYAIGAGVELACACDLVLARAGSYFQVPAGRLGVVYHAAGLRRMERRFGAAGLRAMLLLGRRIDAKRALHLGAVDELAEDPELDASLAEMIADLARADRHSLAAHRAWLRARLHLGEGRPDPDAHQRRREAAYARLRPKVGEPTPGAG